MMKSRSKPKRWAEISQRLEEVEKKLTEERRLAGIAQTSAAELRLIHAKLAAIQLELALMRRITTQDILKE